MPSRGRSRTTRTASRKSSGAGSVRIERDTMGEMEVPADALYGASTQRAVLNFPVSGRRLPLPLIQAFVELKRASAEANGELGQVPRNRTRLISTACRKLLAGLDGRDEQSAEWWYGHFPIDVYQTGSGTSTNMNVNEVLSNLACMEAGAALGSKDPVHPNDHVNQGQSSNDTFPTAMQIAATVSIVRELIPALEKLAASLRKKEKKWDSIVKTGRTHLQDATPIRLGQEFGGFAAQIENGVQRAQRAAKRMGLNLPIGGTAVGTGINTHEDFGNLVAKSLSRRLKIDFAKARNHFEAQSTRDCMVEASGELKTIAISLSKIANDIRWLASGPRCGIGELTLPAIQPGSSIMPAKVNPVICESVVQIACQVVGHDAAISLGSFGGVGSLLQLNVAMPMIAWNMQDSIHLLASGATILRTKAIDGLQANKKTLEGFVERSLMMCTSLAPLIGYEAAAKLAKDAFAGDRSIRELALEQELAHPDHIQEALEPWSMTMPTPAGSEGGKKRSRSTGKRGH